MLKAVTDFILQIGLDKTYWLAYSGGLGSHVLLSLCQQIRKQYPLQLKAIHINHQISDHAHEWAKHCAKICDAYNVSYVEHQVEVPCNNGESLEEVARNKRYAVFASFMQKNDVLLTAHHQDDQAETLLLQLLRGAGPKGLAAMPELKSFADGLHARPLLAFSRSELENYAKQQSLIWIDDESNLNTNLTRNFIRHEILAKLKTRWPTVTQTLSRSAMHCAELQTLLEEITLDDLKQVQGSIENTLSVKKILAFDIKKQKLMLRAWIYQAGFTLPSAKKCESICTNVLMAKKDRAPCVQWKDVEVRRYRD